MTTDPNKETAKIYAFPTRQNASSDRSVGARHEDAKSRAPLVTPTECGAGWYHDAAIQEDTLARDSKPAPR